jgi:hypothetical protein
VEFGARMTNIDGKPIKLQIWYVTIFWCLDAMNIYFNITSTLGYYLICLHWTVCVKFFIAFVSHRLILGILPVRNLSALSHALTTAVPRVLCWSMTLLAATHSTT